MHKLLFLLPFLFFMSCNSSKTASTNDNITFKVMFTADYCGGAYPSDEILENLKKPKALTNELIYVKGSAENADMMSFETNEEGEFTTSFTEGEFEVFLKEKIAAEDCEKWSSKSNGTFTVVKNANNQMINVHRTCNPCDEPSR